MQNQVFRPYNPQSGSIFVWIFVMIFLFAAISYVMIQSTRSGVNTLSADKAKLVATEILDYGRQVREGVRSLRADGVPLNKLSFNSDTYLLQDGTSFSLPNNNCSTDDCEVFAPGAGGVKAQQFYEYGAMPPWWDQTWGKVGSMEFIMARIDGIGTSLSDLVMRIIRVKPEICQAIDKMNGIDKWPVAEDVSGENYYSFSWNVDSSIAATDAYRYGNDEPSFAGKTVFCDGDPLGGDVVIVLEAR